MQKASGKFIFDSKFHFTAMALVVINCPDKTSNLCLSGFWGHSQMTSRKFGDFLTHPSPFCPAPMPKPYLLVSQKTSPLPLCVTSFMNGPFMGLGPSAKSKEPKLFFTIALMTSF